MDKIDFTEWLEIAKKTQKEDKNFDWDKSFEEWFLDYFDNHYDTKKSDARLARYMVNEMDEYDRIDGENRRWSRTVMSICKVGDRFFAIDWEEGLTEMQENEYDFATITEVEKVEKTVVVTSWEAIK